MSRNRHYLIIHRANVEDSGVYKCLAVNKLGRRERDFKIRVIGICVFSLFINKTMEII